MAYSGVTISIAKGQNVPKAYLELALKENPSTCSLAFYDATEKALRYMRDQAEEKNPQFTADQLVTELEKFKDHSVILHLSSSDDPLAEMCLQPFEVLVDAEKEPTMMVFVEGDFSSFTQTQATQTDEYFAANKFIIPFIKKQYAAVGQDMTKLMAELNDPINKQSLANSSVSSGVITLVTQGHAPLSFEKGNGGSAFPWGWVSKTYGYKEQAPAAAAAAPAKSGLISKAKNALSIRGAKQPDTPVITAPPAPAAPKKDDELPPPGNKEGPVSGPKTDIEAAHQELAEGEHEMITPPKELKGKNLKGWYERNCTFVPPNFYEHPAAPKKKVIKAFSEIPKPKDGEVKYTHTDTRQPAEILPIVPPDKLEASKLHIVNLDRNNKELEDDPKTWTGLVAKYATLTQQHGVGDDAYDNKSYNWFKELQDLDKADGTYSLAILAFDFRNRIKDLEANLSDLTAPESGNTSGLPHNPPTAEPKKAAGGGFSIRRQR